MPRSKGTVIERSLTGVNLALRQSEFQQKKKKTREDIAFYQYIPSRSEKLFFKQIVIEHLSIIQNHLLLSTIFKKIPSDHIIKEGLTSE